MSDPRPPGERQALLHSATETTSPTKRPSMPARHQQHSSFARRRHLSTLDLARLTVCMLGVQFTCKSTSRTVELGYGTPYLLSLGISKTLTPLVWLAGPLSGLIIQPIVGVFSDSINWKWGRRRPFIVTGAALMIVSMYMVAYAREIATLLTGHWGQKPGSDAGELTEEFKEAYAGAIKKWTIGIAVLGFYFLDFAINAVQACCRFLIVDTPPTDQQEMGGAWSGWMNNLGSVVGFFAGNLDLVKYFSPYLGDSQIKILANLAVIILVSCLGITCFSVDEVQYHPTEEEKARTAWTTVGNIWRAFNKLPAELQRICNVQFFAWMGWFPFLFYTTSWVGEILHRHDDDNAPSSGDPTAEIERAGSFALLCWAGVAVLSGALLPKITPQEIGRSRWPKNPFSLKNLWTMSLVMFSVAMGLTWFVDDLWAATAVIMLCGVPWAVAMWVPFAMIGEINSDMKDRLEARARASQERLHGYSSNGPSYGAITTQDHPQDQADDELMAGSSSIPSDTVHEDDASIQEQSSLLGYGLVTPAELDAEERGARERGRVHLDAGLVLGVHNMYIVFPQFVDALVASCLFALIGLHPPQNEPLPDPSVPGSPPGYEHGSFNFMSAFEPEPVGWVLRFGGIMALVGAYLTRRL
ncbi:hypothetical protein BGZ68_008572 [Mortierella alpina]|nr:hypothetical protein BGZ68_008572 [Mortierella alpina]